MHTYHVCEHIDQLLHNLDDLNQIESGKNVRTIESSNNQGCLLMEEFMQELRQGVQIIKVLFEEDDPVRTSNFLLPCYILKEWARFLTFGWKLP